MGESWTRYWANKYSWALKRRNDLDFEDLLQSAYMGEYIAKMKYTPDKGEFSKFSAFYIRNELRDLLGIRNGSLPPVMISLDEAIPGADGESVARLDLLEDESIPDKDETLHRQEQREGVIDAIKRLKNPQQREIMYRFYIDGQGAKAIAAAHGLTQRRVLHIVADGRNKMRRDRLLRRIAGIKIPHVYVSVRQFQLTHTSATELAFFMMEEEREGLERCIERIT